MAKDTHCSDKCCGSDVKAEDCKCPPTCKHCNCNAVNEGLADMADIAERDHEVQMARAELYKLAKYAIKLHDMLKGVSEAEGIEGWMQSKITKAADYIGSVYHTMDYDMATESKKTHKNTLTNEGVNDYKNDLAERMAQKKSKIDEISKDKAYKYWHASYDDETEKRGDAIDNKRELTPDEKRKIANRKAGRKNATKRVLGKDGIAAAKAAAARGKAGKKDKASGSSAFGAFKADRKKAKDSGET